MLPRFDRDPDGTDLNGMPLRIGEFEEGKTVNGLSGRDFLPDGTILSVQFWNHGTNSPSGTSQFKTGIREHVFAEAENAQGSGNQNEQTFLHVNPPFPVSGP